VVKEIANQTTASDPASDPASDSTDSPADRAEGERKDWNPYLAGVALGLVLLATYLVMGFGLGASSAPTRAAIGAAHLVAPHAVESNGYFSNYLGGDHNVLDDWMVFEVVGVLLGGVIGAYSGRRMRRAQVSRGPRIGVTSRLGLAVAGGVVMGFAARLARGCTSGQALTGGAVLSAGAWLFMLAVFAGAYAMAPLVRRQWR